MPVLQYTVRYGKLPVRDVRVGLSRRRMDPVLIPKVDMKGPTVDRKPYPLNGGGGVADRHY